MVCCAESSYLHLKWYLNTTLAWALLLVLYIQEVIWGWYIRVWIHSHFCHVLLRLIYLIFNVECKDIIKLVWNKPLKCSIYLYCLIIRRWHKINIPDTSRPSAMTHRDDEKKEAVSEAISFLYPVMKYALLLLHQLHIRESGRIPFLTIWHTSTHIKKLLM